MLAIIGFLVLAVIFFVLFLLPGIAITGVFFPRDDLDVFQRLPIGFSFILGIFLIVFLIATALSLDWRGVLWMWGSITLILIVGGIARWQLSPNDKYNESGTKWQRIDIVVLVFVILLTLAALLTFFTPRDEDDWSYYPIVRGFVDAQHFLPVSPTRLRAGLSVWWFFHAFLIRTSNVDIVRLGQDYLPLLLVPLSLLAFYAFARTLLGNRNKAVAATVLQLAFYVIDLFYNDPDVQLTGGWVLGRIDQDHTAAQFIFLPIYLMLVFRYIESGALRWLTASFIALVTLSAVHPQGFVQASVLTSVFLLVHLLLTRQSETFKRIALLLIPFTAVLILLVPFILFWSDFSRTAGFDLSYLAAGQSSFPFTFRWITFLSPQAFILRPDLLSQPLLLSALLFTPVLVTHLRGELGARYLFSSMLALLAVLFIPLPFVALSRWLGWPIYRFWYLFPSVLVIVFLTPQLFHRIAVTITQLRHRAWNRQVLAGSLYLAGMILVASRFPYYIRGAPAELALQERLPAGAQELYAALCAHSSESGVVLAPRNVSDPIPSYCASLYPVLFRYSVPQQQLDDATVFYASRVLTASDLEILSKYDVGYLVVPADGESISQFDLSSKYFMSLYRNQNWALYRVNQPLIGNMLVQANTLFIESDLQGAIDAYNRALFENPNNSLAHLGLGMVLEVLDKPRLAAQELEEAVRIAPNNVQAHYHLASVYRKLGMDQQADIHAAAAGALKGQSQ